MQCSGSALFLCKKLCNWSWVQPADAECQLAHDNLLIRTIHLYQWRMDWKVFVPSFYCGFMFLAHNLWYIYFSWAFIDCSFNIKWWSSMYADSGFDEIAHWLQTSFAVIMCFRIGLSALRWFSTAWSTSSDSFLHCQQGRCPFAMDDADLHCQKAIAEL